VASAYQQRLDGPYLNCCLIKIVQVNCDSSNWPGPGCEP